MKALFFAFFVNGMLTNSVNKLLTLLTKSERVPYTLIIREVDKNGEILSGFEDNNQLKSLQSPI